MTKSLCLTVWVPVIVSLVVSVPFLERVIQVTIQPVELWNNTKVKWHLGILVWSVLVALTNWVQHFVSITVDDLITQVVMWFLPIILRDVRGVEISCCHLIKLL